MGVELRRGICCRLFKATAFVLLILLFSACVVKLPVIESIDPKIGRLGDVITLSGSNFGDEREESYVTIAGTSPTSSSYYAWQDDTIMVKVPESGESGLVYVYVNGRRSNGVLFSNSASVPLPVEGEEPGFDPVITSFNPRIGQPGTVIVITGRNFGNSRENGGVFFPRSFEPQAYNPYAKVQGFIEAAGLESGYEFWSDREIRIRVPDGAVSGGIEVRTVRGNSRPVTFDVSGMPGTKTFSDKRSYTISYAMDVKVLEATRPNSLYLWMPQPVNSPSQQTISMLSRSMDPFMDNYRGTSLFKLDNLASGATAHIVLSYQVDVYAQETSVRPQSIRQDEKSPLAVYTQSGNFILPNEAVIKNHANAIIGRERNPYTRARMIYEWFIREMKITETQSVNITEALEARQADSYLAALLYCSMVRAAGVPCIPVAGVLVSRTLQTIRHYWAEFWIDGFGWVPVDPVMGAGAIPASFQQRQDYANYFFGNMDSQRIAFSRGEVTLSQMDSRGRLVSHNRSYSLQNIWEEAAGGLEFYSSLWGDITITGVYIQ
jgi:hypothetical protein